MLVTLTVLTLALLMLFGTFRNPRRWDARCGFGGREVLLGDMLLGRDVNAGSPHQ